MNRIVIGAALVAALGACKATPRAVAERVASREQLVGGPDSLGDLGDLALSNGKVHFVIQGISERSNYSRGWGVYGGSLLDADLVRPGQPTGSQPAGRDAFGEMFPAWFLEAIEPESVEIGNDGSDGKPATVVVTGHGSPFLSMARTLNDVALSPDGLVFRNTYSLGPNDQFLTITSELVNPEDAPNAHEHRFDGSKQLGLDVGIPFGSVLLFGNRNDVFVPGAGFDLRYSLEDAYAKPSRLPALPGLVTDLVATKSDGVSYGVAVGKPQVDEWSYTWRNREKIGPEARTDTMLVPFFASSFTGVFSAQPPDVLKVGETFRYTTYFIVGNGDVGSVRDVQFELQKAQTGRMTALVREAVTNRVVPGASVVVLDENGRPFSQYTPDEQGRVSGRLPAGMYFAQVVCDHRETTRRVAFMIKPDVTTEVASVDPAVPGEGSRTLWVPQNARLDVRISEAPSKSSTGRPLPAKVTLVGGYTWDDAHANQPPRKFLYDLALGERMRPTDGVPDTQANPASRDYIERVILSGADGLATGEVKPGRYEVHVSRGPEYSDFVFPQPVDLAPGQVVELAATLSRVVDTAGWVSGDFHVHTSNSIDGHIELDDRVRSYAAEGVEYLAATDHNVVTDLAPNVDGLRLGDFVKTTVGLEMTTLEMGHFNAFPLKYDPSTPRHGAFDWVNLPPRDLFQQLRSMGSTPPDTVVQINHPRDSILGYFHQFNVSQDSLMPRAGNPIASPNGDAFGLDKFSWAYDAMEVFNGKRHELLRTYRMPAELPPGPHPDVPAKPGDVVRVPCPKAKPDCDYSKQDIAFPGSVEDWFEQLNLGGQSVQLGSDATSRETIPPVTATGNSDSHGLYFEEAGYPRNWVFVGEDEPRKISDQMLARAVRRHKVVFSNGPFIDVQADGSGFGETRTSPVGGLLAPMTDVVKLNVTVSAPPWIAVDRVIVYVNGKEAARQKPDSPDRTHTVRCCVLPIEVKVSGDAWIVVSAEGDESMFPYLSPLEEPPLAISDAVKAVAGPLGLGDDGMGNLRPAAVHPATPFAMTNPIWIDRTGAPNGGPDGVSFGRGSDVVVVGAGQQPLVVAGTQTERAEAPPPVRIPDAVKFHRSSDLGKLFRAWGHGHSH